MFNCGNFFLKNGTVMNACLPGMERTTREMKLVEG